MNDNKIALLAANMRRDVVQMIGFSGQTGHLGGSCSLAEIVATLYGEKMRHDPKNPAWPERDKFILSKGHAALVQYAALAETGYFSKDELLCVKTLGANLQGHPDRLKTPGIEAGTGSLGQGLSVALGMALAMKLDGLSGKVYCIVGDGEIAEGQIWEAAMAAVNYRADNLIAIVDRNRLQATGAVRERFNTDPLSAKWAGFGWNVLEMDGHSIPQIRAALEDADTVKGKPSVVIASTVKGNGVSFAENVVGFHNGALTPQQYEQALAELDARIAELEEGARA